ncbi:MAG: TolC family protein [Candidatus Omnitrophica bacterium]|nr:TolC family protein [Candidatus Omnitrophota bacterium]
MRPLRALIVSFLMLCLFTSPGTGYAQEDPLPAPAPRPVSLNECVVYGIGNAFDVQLAKLDLYIAQTDLMYEEAVYDTLLYGDMNYSEDRRNRLSVFAGNDDQDNEYSAGLNKTLYTGTEVTAEFSDNRLWDDTAYVTQNPSHTTELLLKAEQPVGVNAFGINDRRKISLTKLAINNAGLNEQDKIEAYIARVEKAYWGMVFERRSFNIYADMLQKAKRLHEVNLKNFNLGIIEKVDLVASESNVALRQTDVLLVVNAYARAKENLKLLMNLEDDVDIMPTKDLKYVCIQKELPDCMKEAFEQRRDYKIAKTDLKIKGLDLKIESNKRWPEIDLTASMAMNGIEKNFGKAFDDLTAEYRPYYYAGLEVSVPIENRQARANYDKAKYRKEKALVNIKDIERTIITEVVNAYRDVVSYEASIVYLKRAVTLQSEKLKEEEKRFSYGRSTTKHIIDYQQDLSRAELEEAIFLLKHEKSKIDLNRYMNAILPKYEELL